MLIAYGELIAVLLDIEENTRGSRHLLDQMADARALGLTASAEPFGRVDPAAAPTEEARHVAWRTMSPDQIASTVALLEDIGTEEALKEAALGCRIFVERFPQDERAATMKSLAADFDARVARGE